MLRSKKDVVTSLLGLGGTVEPMTDGLTLVTHNSSTLGMTMYVLSIMHNEVLGAGASKVDLVNNLRANNQGHVALCVQRSLPDLT